MINSLNSVSFAGLHPYGTGNDGGIARAQAYGYAREMARKVDEFSRNMERRHALGLISNDEYRRFSKSSFEDRMRHLQSPCTPCY